MASPAKRKLYNRLPTEPGDPDPQVLAATKDYPPKTSAIQAFFVLGLGTFMVLMRDYPHMVPEGAESARWTLIPLAAVWFLSFSVLFFQRWWEGRVGHTFYGVLLASYLMALGVMFGVFEFGPGPANFKCHLVHTAVLPQVCIDQMKKMWSLLLLDLAPALTFAFASPGLQAFALRISSK